MDSSASIYNFIASSNFPPNPNSTIFCNVENLFKNEKVEVVTTNGLSPYIGPQILNEVYYV